jgi:hypothetical protein
MKSCKLANRDFSDVKQRENGNLIKLASNHYLAPVHMKTIELSIWSKSQMDRYFRSTAVLVLHVVYMRSICILIIRSTWNLKSVPISGRLTSVSSWDLLTSFREASCKHFDPLSFDHIDNSIVSMWTGLVLRPRPFCFTENASMSSRPHYRFRSVCPRPHRNAQIRFCACER